MMKNGESLKGHLDTLILAAVDHTPSHGYAIIEQLRTGSGGRFDLADGTVYPALHRLEKAGLLRSHWETVGGRKRREYDLTDAGRRALRERREDWKSFSRGVSAILA